MNKESFEFFLHGNGKPQVLTAVEDEALRDVLARFDALPRDGEVVFVGESEEAVDKPDDAEDTHAPVDVGATLHALHVRQLRHVHTRAVRRTEVTVYFNGKHHERRFSPATTVATVLEWAKKVFKIDSAAGAELILALRPSGTHPRPEEHLGELLQPGVRSLEFDLVREVTPQG
jgi:hypothetical protein